MFIIVYMLSPEFVESDRRTWRNIHKHMYKHAYGHRFMHTRTHTAYLLDLALLGSRAALLHLEVPEITVLFCLNSVMK